MKLSRMILIMALVLAMLLCIVACDTEETVIPEQNGQENESPSDASDPQGAGSDTDAPTHKIHIDAEPQDGKCDVCGKDVPCAGCADIDPKDGKCDLCGKDVACTHTYADTYTSDSTHHWKAATCGCTVDPREKGAHEDVNPKDAKCDVCGKAVPCVTCVDESPKNAKCDVCGKAVPCVTCVDNKNGVKDGRCDVCKKAYTHAPIDNSFEETAKQHLATQGPIAITQVSDINITGLPFPLRMEQTVTQKRDANGNILQSQSMDSYRSYGGVEELFSSTSTLVKQIGNDFYVTSYQDSETETTDARIFISATQNEIDDLEDQIFEGVNAELAYSVNHFRAVNIATDGDGNTIYTCYGLRTESADAYNQICQNMMAAAGQSATFSLKPNSFVYKITVDANGKIVSAELSMDVSAVVSGVSVTYEITSAQTYFYEVDEIEAPQINNKWIGMTLTEYFGMAQGIPCENNGCADNNANGLCDACGTRVGAIPHLGECTDGQDLYSGYCDVCRKPMSE